jgi:hypothetical protein
MALTMDGGTLIERDQTMYQVLVDYFDTRAGVWSGPMESGDAARDRYARECGRLHKGGIRRVLLCKGGIVVAQASC